MKRLCCKTWELEDGVSLLRFRGWMPMKAVEAAFDKIQDEMQLIDGLKLERKGRTIKIDVRNAHV